MHRLLWISGIVVALFTVAAVSRGAPATAPPAPTGAAPPTSSPPDAAVLSTQSEKTSYSLGLVAGSQLRQSMDQYMDLDTSLTIAGFRDGVNGGKTLMSEEEAQIALKALGERMVAKRKELAIAFLAENAKQAKVKTTPSGLQYRVIEAGLGDPPKVNDSVVVHYAVALTDGTVVDSSRARGKPISFRIGARGIIRGMSEALQMMNSGAKWQVFVPPNLAYGASASGRIPPNSVLRTDLELISIKRSSEAGP